MDVIFCEDGGVFWDAECILDKRFLYGFVFLFGRLYGLGGMFLGKKKDVIKFSISLVVFRID